jgi:hypothetical protein
MSDNLQTRNYCLGALNLHVSCSATIAACLDERFRLLSSERSGRETIYFEFQSVRDGSQHIIQKPAGRARPFYELPNGEAYSFECGNELYLSFRSGVRGLCKPALGRAWFSVVEAEPGALFLISHLLLTIFLVEILKWHGWYSLHAAGFSNDGRAILIPGTSGAGKSTLSVALLRAKFDYLSDDMVFLLKRPHGWGVVGLPEDVDVTDQTVGFFSELDFLLQSPKAEGFPKWQVRAEEVYGTAVVREARPCAIVFPRISGKGISILTEIEPDEAFLEIVPNVLLTGSRCCQAHLDALTEVVKQTPCYRLETGRDFDRIPHLFRELLSASREEACV